MFSPAQYREQAKRFQQENPHAKMYLSERTLKAYADSFLLWWIMSLREEIKLTGEMILEIRLKFYEAAGIESEQTGN